MPKQSSQRTQRESLGDKKSKDRKVLSPEKGAKRVSKRGTNPKMEVPTEIQNKDTEKIQVSKKADKQKTTPKKKETDDKLNKSDQSKKTPVIEIKDRSRAESHERDDADRKDRSRSRSKSKSEKVASKSSDVSKQKREEIPDRKDGDGGKGKVLNFSSEEELDYDDDVDLQVEALISDGESTTDDTPTTETRKGTPSDEIMGTETPDRSRKRHRGSEEQRKRDKKHRRKHKSHSRSRSRSVKRRRRKIYYDDTSSSSSEDEDISIEKVLKLMKKLKNEKKNKRRSRRSRSRSKASKRRASSSSTSSRSRSSSPVDGKAKSKKTKRGSDAYKSLSDFTLYKPAIACVGTSPNMKHKYVERIDGEQVKDRPAKDNKKDRIISNNVTPTKDDSQTTPTDSMENDKFIDRFLTQMRIDTDSDSNSGNHSKDTTRGENSNGAQIRSEVRVPEKSRLEMAREDADNNLLKAERYKAELLPEGMWDKLKKLVQANSDDEFFYTNCHIDSVIREKIKLGKFVELEKLLVRRKGSRPKSEQKLDIISKDGVTSITSTEDRESRITNIHKWDQAFRVYTTIYTKANPERGAEIWQYIDTIHRASRTFNWDSVAEYDYCFRQLMAEYPQRSWSQIYTQMWNLTLCEGGQRQASHGSAQGNRKERSEPYCWKFNKSKCNYGPKCRFEHRCSYCFSYNHGYQHCPRKPGGRKDKDKKERRRGSSEGRGHGHNDKKEN